MLVLDCGSIERQSTWFVFRSAWIWSICVVTSCCVWGGQSRFPLIG